MNVIVYFLNKSLTLLPRSDYIIYGISSWIS